MLFDLVMCAFMLNLVLITVKTMPKIAIHIFFCCTYKAKSESKSHRGNITNTSISQITTNIF